MPSSRVHAPGSPKIVRLPVTSAIRAPLRLKKAKRSFGHSRTMWLRCWSVSFPGTANHGSEGRKPASTHSLEMVDLRAAASRLCDQLHGPPDTGECRGSHHDAVSSQPGTIRQPGTALRIGFFALVHTFRHRG